MTWLQGFLRSVAHDRRWWWALLVINFLGSLYGFYWYWPQLSQTPPARWFIVPDSPGATFLFAIWLGLLLAGVDWRSPGMQLLGAVAFVSNMKYGLWTATVLPQAGMKYGWEFDFVHLSLSHLGMWVQGFLFARHYRPGPAAAAVALAWMVVQDTVDYRLWMTHPTLPYQAEFAFARGAAVALSLIWGLFLLGQSLSSRRHVHG
ncbi:DUF1405 domain-containing protein [Symbiobacterium thermophilum]|uniref:DUF1405 domain-containing protein n=3 Tax=Symbiobacterium thermophilum TaxID=2734 RepID=Q67LB0_SYMTH|nr:DUF1405 domain-containing protein [Symbiobacterium thermophilum]MBY6274853.1 DUF1405 domain-containing protein [Symbiobacterium thermophilum]BAD41536.1 conserved hypothetical protein [Symbiobacterium thermophilum IAM 14863]